MPTTTAINDIVIDICVLPRRPIAPSPQEQSQLFLFFSSNQCILLAAINWRLLSGHHKVLSFSLALLVLVISRLSLTWLSSRSWMNAAQTWQKLLLSASWQGGCKKDNEKGFRKSQLHQLRYSVRGQKCVLSECSTALRARKSTNLLFLYCSTLCESCRSRQISLTAVSLATMVLQLVIWKWAIPASRYTERVQKAKIAKRNKRESKSSSWRKRTKAIRATRRQWQRFAFSHSSFA